MPIELVLELKVQQYSPTNLPQHNPLKQPQRSNSRQNLAVALQVSKMFHQVFLSRERLLHKMLRSTDNLLLLTHWRELTKISQTKDKVAKTIFRGRKENALVGELRRTLLPQPQMM